MPLRTNPLTKCKLYYPLSLSSHSTDHPPSNMPTFSYAAVIRSYIHDGVHCELSILVHVVGFLCLLVIYILILFDMVILFNMKTFKKHTNKCAILGTSLAGDIQQLLNSSGARGGYIPKIFYIKPCTVNVTIWDSIWCLSTHPTYSSHAIVG